MLGAPEDFHCPISDDSAPIFPLLGKCTKVVQNRLPKCARLLSVFTRRAGGWKAAGLSKRVTP